MQKIQKAALVLDFKNDPEKASEILLEVIDNTAISKNDPIRIEALAFLVEVCDVYQNDVLLRDMVEEVNRLEIGDIEPDLVDQHIETVRQVAFKYSLTFKHPDHSTDE